MAKKKKMKQTEKDMNKRRSSLKYVLPMLIKRYSNPSNTLTQ